MKLRTKQKLFCEKFVLNGYNATQAYIDAGYSCAKKTTAGTNSSKLLTNANIKSYIRTLEAQRDGEFKVEKDDILKELSKMAFGNLDDIIEFENGRPKIKEEVDPIKKRNALAAISSVSSSISYSKDGQAKSFSINAKDKIKALELMAKMTGVLDGGINKEDEKPSISRVLESIRNIGK